MSKDPLFAIARLEQLVENDIQDGRLRHMCLGVIRHPRFAIGFGSRLVSSHPHHNYPGGLAVHTCEVAHTAVAMQGDTWVMLKPVNEDVLITAAIFHDFMKILDYDEAGKETSYQKLIRHVSGSYAAFEKQASFCGIENHLREQIGHCILAHHGRKEWGSPIEPQTVEAQMLHFADMLSMGFGAGK